MKESNYWDQKPFWCQPWSIILFGIFLILTSFFIIKSLFFTIFTFVIVLVWWTLFLLLAPKYYKDQSF